MIGCREGNLGRRNQFKSHQIIPRSAPPPFPWALRGPTAPQLRLQEGGPRNQRSLLWKGLTTPAWGHRGLCHPSPYPSLPARRRQERASAGPRRCTITRASARERAPGRALARWRPRRGRRLGQGTRSWERRAAAPRLCQSWTRCPGPGPGWSPRTPSPRPQPRCASGLGAGQPPPHPRPYPGPAALQRPGDCPCPPSAPRSPSCLPTSVPSLVPLSWKIFLPSPGPPMLGFLSAYIQPWLLKDP